MFLHAGKDAITANAEHARLTIWKRDLEDPNASRDRNLEKAKNVTRFVEAIQLSLLTEALPVQEVK